eukprot:scaffold1650_cov351-Prasinococcus_capsulatus_cf.AAC.24
MSSSRAASPLVFSSGNSSSTSSTSSYSGSSSLHAPSSSEDEETVEKKWRSDGGVSAAETSVGDDRPPPFPAAQGSLSPLPASRLRIGAARCGRRRRVTTKSSVCCMLSTAVAPQRGPLPCRAPTTSPPPQGRAPQPGPKKGTAAKDPRVKDCSADPTQTAPGLMQTCTRPPELALSWPQPRAVSVVRDRLSIRGPPCPAEPRRRSEARVCRHRRPHAVHPPRRPPRLGRARRARACEPACARPRKRNSKRNSCCKVRAVACTCGPILPKNRNRYDTCHETCSGDASYRTIPE